MGNIDNLIKNEDLTPEQRRDHARKAGIASGKKRHERKLFLDAFRDLLSGKYEIDGEKQTGYDAISAKMIAEALGGNVKAFIAIRDTVGEKPTETIGFEDEDSELTGIKIRFVNKSKQSQSKEKDPKIVGEYTPPSNTEDGA